MKNCDTRCKNTKNITNLHQHSLSSKLAATKTLFYACISINSPRTVENLYHISLDHNVQRRDKIYFTDEKYLF